MKKLSQNKAITLMALVITIVILLILAGIALASITGENGIVNKSKQAKNGYEYAQAKEEIIVAIKEAKAKSDNPNLGKTFGEALEEEFNKDPLKTNNTYTPKPITKDDKTVSGINRGIYEYNIDLETGKIVNNTDEEAEEKHNWKLVDTFRTKNINIVSQQEIQVKQI